MFTLYGDRCCNIGLAQCVFHGFRILLESSFHKNRDSLVWIPTPSLIFPLCRGFCITVDLVFSAGGNTVAI